MNISEKNHHYCCCTTLINITLLNGESINHTACFPNNLKSMGVKTIPGSHCLNCTPTIKSALQPIPFEKRMIPFYCMHSSKHHECIIYITKLYKKHNKNVHQGGASPINHESAYTSQWVDYRLPSAYKLQVTNQICSNEIGEDPMSSVIMLPNNVICIKIIISHVFFHPRGEWRTSTQNLNQIRSE